ncbi:hypothetical protein GCM10027570_22220 [Streptomonospora sediminis]
MDHFGGRRLLRSCFQYFRRLNRAAPSAGPPATADTGSRTGDPFAVAAAGCAGGLPGRPGREPVPRSVRSTGRGCPRVRARVPGRLGRVSGPTPPRRHRPPA